MTKQSNQHGRGGLRETPDQAGRYTVTAVVLIVNREGDSSASADALDLGETEFLMFPRIGERLTFVHREQLQTATVVGVEHRIGPDPSLFITAKRVPPPPGPGWEPFAPSSR